MEKLFDILEFNKIKDLILKHNINELSRKKVNELQPLFFDEVVSELLDQTKEAYKLVNLGTFPSLGQVTDLTSSLEKEENYVEEESLLKNGTTIKGTAIPMSNVNNSIPSNATKEWLEDLQQYYVQYEQGGYVYKMWIEDEESFAKKMKLVKDYNLAGAAYWRKGFESKSVWKIIKENLDM